MAVRAIEGALLIDALSLFMLSDPSLRLRMTGQGVRSSLSIWSLETSIRRRSSDELTD
jgi:hypothetical protein